MSAAPEREWEQLSLDEKLTELGFVRATAGEFDLASVASQKRLHAALDQLMDAGGLINEIEAMCVRAIDKDNPPEAITTLTKIHELVTAE